MRVSCILSVPIIGGVFFYFYKNSPSLLTVLIGHTSLAKWNVIAALFLHVCASQMNTVSHWATSPVSLSVWGRPGICMVKALCLEPVTFSISHFMWAFPVVVRCVVLPCGADTARRHTSHRTCTWSTWSLSLNLKYFQMTIFIFFFLFSFFLGTHVCASSSSCCSAILFLRSSWRTVRFNMVICRCCAVRVKPQTSVTPYFKVVKTTPWSVSRELPKRAWSVTRGKRITCDCDLVYHP